MQARELLLELNVMLPFYDLLDEMVMRHTLPADHGLDKLLFFQQGKDVLQGVLRVP
jgi:hypothetical protein